MPAKKTNNTTYATRSTARAPLELKGVSHAGDGYLLTLQRACLRHRISKPIDLARILAAAGGVTFFISGDGGILVEAAPFGLAVAQARAAGGSL